MEVYIYVAQIIVSIALIVAVVLQSKNGGLGGLMGGAENASMLRTRRGIEKLLFQVTIGLAVVFFALAILIVYVVG